jgi:hypothetical protein
MLHLFPILLSLTASAEEPAAVDVVLGPIRTEAVFTPPDPRQLALGTCLQSLPPMTLDADQAIDNALLLQVRVRRGRVKLVTVAHVSPGLEPMAPCLERELYRIDWGIKKADLEVPVTIIPAEAAE